MALCHPTCDSHHGFALRYLKPTSAPRLGSQHPHLRWDWPGPCPICAGTGVLALPSALCCAYRMQRGRTRTGCVRSRWYRACPAADAANRRPAPTALPGQSSDDANSQYTGLNGECIDSGRGQEGAEIVATSNEEPTKARQTSGAEADGVHTTFAIRETKQLR